MLWLRSLTWRGRDQPHTTLNDLRAALLLITDKIENDALNAKRQARGIIIFAELTRLNTEFSFTEFAWVTLATNDSYSLGALVVANSLKKVATKHQLAVLITPGVTAPMRAKLATVFNVVEEVNVLDSKDAANLALLARPELGITFTKLHCWRLTQFEKCVFLDADTLVSFSAVLCVATNIAIKMCAL